MVKIRPNGSLPLNFNSFPLPLPLIRQLFSRLMAHYQLPLEKSDKNCDTRLV